jgi:hypothetical protein
MKHIKYLGAIFIFLPSVIYSQYLEMEDINIFINGYVQIKNIVDEHRDDGEDADWIKYDELMDTFSTVAEEYIKKQTNNKFNELKGKYQEIINCKTPQKLENIFQKIGWETDGNKKYLTITMCWGFLYAVKEMERETDDIPKWIFKLFVEKYYLGLLNVLKIFNEEDLNIINMYTEEIEDIILI